MSSSPPSLHLINPRAEFPTYFAAEVFHGWGLPASAFVADLAIVSVAAMAAERGFSVAVTDEALGDVTAQDVGDASVIGLTGKVNQWPRTEALARRFRSEGRTVLIGGPFASLSPEVVRPHADVLVRGELEGCADELFADLLAGRAAEEYEGGRPDLSLPTPTPRWDLYDNGRAMMGVVQTSRGCPFDCEFCDVIQYLGRKQRFKPSAGVIAELEELYRHGHRDVFLADDNFTVNRRRARELLRDLQAWNEARGEGPVSFYTQASVDAAKDPALLQACAQAGLNGVFIGIETPNEASLKETRKPQNVGVDLDAEIRKFVAAGIAVDAGLIVGFDNDGPDIFDWQRGFALDSCVPLFSLGALVAPAATPLHARLSEAGRLVDAPGADVQGAPWETNIVPLRMTRTALTSGLVALVEDLYAPKAFEARLLRLLKGLGPRRDPATATGRALAGARQARPVFRDSRRLLIELAKRDSECEALCLNVYRALRKRPDCADVGLNLLLRYSQVLFMLDQARRARQRRIA